MKWIQSPLLLALGLALALVGCLLSLSSRVKVENENKNVLVTAEFDLIENLASAQGMFLKDGLDQASKSGIGGVVIPEQTIGDLLLDGKAQLISITTKGSQASDVTALKVTDPSILGRVSRGLMIRFGDLARSTTPRGNILALPPVDANTIRTTAVGMSPAACDLAKKAGLTIIGRGSNPVGISSVGVKATLQWFKEMGAIAFLPQGDQVLGRRESLDAVVSGLKENHLLYASPEFTKLGGDTETLIAVPELSVRLHSAQSLELDHMTQAAAIERYSKAARERGMRILLLRPLSNAAEKPLLEFTNFSSALQSELQHVGLMAGNPEPFSSPKPTKVATILIGIGGAIAVFWTMCQFLGGAPGLVVGLLAGLIALAGGFSSGSLASIGAFTIATVAPISGFILLEKLKPKSVLVGILLVMVTALIAGLCVAGLLNDTHYLIRAKTFIGVKFAVSAPILAVGWYYFSRLCNTREALASPITWGSALLGLLIIAALGFMISRSGNDGPAGVLGGELEFRGLLEKLLPVRPRTKEFLLGFPLLTIGLFLYSKAEYDVSKLGKSAGWVALLIMLGGIASTDVVNTFCHIHTPLLASLLRVVEGLVLGCILGGLVVVIGTRFRKTAVG